jgi:hypothetical protein
VQSDLYFVEFDLSIGLMHYAGFIKIQSAE